MPRRGQSGRGIPKKERRQDKGEKRLDTGEGDGNRRRHGTAGLCEARGYGTYFGAW